MATKANSLSPGVHTSGVFLLPGGLALTLTVKEYEDPFKG
jgi:hypothetical protein